MHRPDIKLPDFFLGQISKRALVTLGACIAALLIFAAGIAVGRHSRFEYSGRFGGSGFGPMGMRGMPHFFIMSDHGAVGSVASVMLPNITVVERDGMTQNIVVSSTTIVRAATLMSGDSASSPPAIRSGEFIVALGTSDMAGNLHAMFIRILPAQAGLPPAPFSTTTAQ